MCGWLGCIVRAGNAAAPVDEMAGTAFLVSIYWLLWGLLSVKRDAVGNTDPGLFDLRDFVRIVGHQADRCMAELGQHHRAGRKYRDRFQPQRVIGINSISPLS